MSKPQRSKKRSRPPPARISEEDLVKAKILSLPSTTRGHIPARNLEAAYFPADRIIINDSDVDFWKAYPLQGVELLGHVCQSVVATQRVGVYEIRLPVPIRWVHLLAALIHRRTAKMKTTADKFTPRSSDYYRVDERPDPAVASTSHQAIRFFSSCFCGGCLEHNHRPKILVYFDIAAAPDWCGLARQLGINTFAMPKLNGTFKSKVPENVAQEHMISRFFINVQVPHHAACARTVHSVVESWNKQSRQMWLDALPTLRPVTHPRQNQNQKNSMFTPTDFLAWIQQQSEQPVPPQSTVVLLLPSLSSKKGEDNHVAPLSSLQVPVIADNFTQLSWGLGTDGSVPIIAGSGTGIDDHLPTSPSGSALCSISSSGSDDECLFDDDEDSTTTTIIVTSNNNSSSSTTISSNKRRCLHLDSSSSSDGLEDPSFPAFFSAPAISSSLSFFGRWDEGEENQQHSLMLSSNMIGVGGGGGLSEAGCFEAEDFTATMLTGL